MAASGAGGEQVYATVRPLSARALGHVRGSLQAWISVTDSRIAPSERFLPPWSVNYFQFASGLSRDISLTLLQVLWFSHILSVMLELIASWPFWSRSTLCLPTQLPSSR